MIKFKTLKYKHQRQAQELSARIKDKKASPDEISLFVLSLIEAWDFNDAETGEPLPLNGNLASTLSEMSLVQYEEMNRIFNEEMGKATVAVPKVSAAPSSSSSMRSKRVKKQA